jgi:hypothetical protein
MDPPSTSITCAVERPRHGDRQTFSREFVGQSDQPLDAVIEHAGLCEIVTPDVMRNSPGVAPAVVEPQLSPRNMVCPNFQAFVMPGTLHAILPNTSVSLIEHHRDRPVSIMAILAG